MKQQFDGKVMGKQHIWVGGVVIEGHEMKHQKLRMVTQTMTLANPLIIAWIKADENSDTHSYLLMLCVCVCVFLSHTEVEEVVSTELAQQRPACGVQWRLWWCMRRLACIRTHPEGNQGFSISSVPTCTFLAWTIRCIRAKWEWVPGVESTSRATTGTWSSCVREQGIRESNTFITHSHETHHGIQVSFSTQYLLIIIF